MKKVHLWICLGFVAIVLAAILGLATTLDAQYGGTQQQQQQQQQPAQSQQPAPAQQPAQGDQPAIQGVPLTPDAPKTDPEEEKAYTDFSAFKAEQSDQQIAQGEQFVQKYPNSKYDEPVFSRLTQAYYSKQQYDKMYAAADKALGLNPDDVTVLVMVGWVIPHTYDPNDMDADRKLQKAENYERHAMEILAAMQKPASLTDDQFTKSKSAALSQAHSGLGLVYFRRQDYEQSVKELDQAVTLAEKPDFVDYYVLGVGYSHLSRFSDAAAAYQKCAGISSNMSSACKQKAEDAKKQAAAQPAPPKP
jgi:tetratricopeptide (TPR) repeat protein